MATIKFKAKPIKVYNVEDLSVAFEMVRVPALERRHCDMNAFRRHPRYGGIANSDLFPNALKRIRSDLFGPYGEMRLDKVPDNVTVDRSGFLAEVTINV